MALPSIRDLVCATVADSLSLARSLSSVSRRCRRSLSRLRGLWGSGGGWSTKYGEPSPTECLNALVGVDGALLSRVELRSASLSRGDPSC